MEEKPQRVTKTIGNYLLLKCIGHGAFGKVKLARHLPTNQKVAIKIVSKKLLKGPADRNRLRRELDILQKVLHVNVIRLYEVMETKSTIYMVMEFAAGGELFDYIVSNGKLTESEAVIYFKQIIEGLKYCHANNIIHRDLKPENLLFTRKKVLKIVDFGLSNFTQINADGTPDFLKTACGSPAYAPPEMIRGKLYDGFLSDIWSLGVILYALLVGTLPFADNNVTAMCRKIVRGGFRTPDYLSNDAKDLLKKMLTVNPNNRIDLKGVSNHPWCQNISSDSVALTQMKKRQSIYESVDLEVLQEISKYGYNSLKASSDLQSGKRTHVTATYYLLLKKRLAEFNKTTSQSDPIWQIPGHIQVPLEKVYAYMSSLNSQIPKTFTSTMSNSNSKTRRRYSSKNPSSNASTRIPGSDVENMKTSTQITEPVASTSTQSKQATKGRTQKMSQKLSPTPNHNKPTQSTHAKQTSNPSTKGQFSESPVKYRESSNVQTVPPSGTFDNQYQGPHVQKSPNLGIDTNDENPAEITQNRQRRMSFSQKVGKFAKRVIRKNKGANNPNQKRTLLRSGINPELLFTKVKKIFRLEKISFYEFDNRPFVLKTSGPVGNPDIVFEIEIWQHGRDRVGVAQIRHCPESEGTDNDLTIITSHLKQKLGLESC